MCEYLKTKKDITKMIILEVGSWAGTSAQVFSEYFKNVICVDPWKPTKGTISTLYNMDEVEKEFDKVRRKCNNIVKEKARIQDIINNYGDKAFDVIYIDGEHTYKAVKRDIKLCLPKAKYFICGHDYWRNKFDGVIKAVDETLGKPDKVFHDTSWVKEL